MAVLFPHAKIETKKPAISMSSFLEKRCGILIGSAGIKAGFSHGKIGHRSDLSLSGQFFSAFLPTSFQHQATALRFHAFPKAMRHFAPMGIRLECSFHGSPSFASIL